MKITTYKWKSMDLTYPDMLTLETEEDVLSYAKEEKPYQSHDFERVLTAYVNPKSNRDFTNVASHFSRTGMTKVASIACLSEKDECSIMDIANKLDELVNDKIMGMLGAVRNGEIVFINENGGYHFRQKNEDIEIIEEREISVNEMHNYIYKVDKDMYPDKTCNIIYYKGKCYYGTDTHTYLCKKYQTPEDSTLKLIYDYSVDVGEYGVPHLKLSKVYDFTPPELIPSKQDLDIIESTVKEMTEFIKKHKNWYRI